MNQITPPPPHPQAGTRRQPSRPRTAEQLQELVLMLARANDWGYTRILGELKKLGITTSRSNVVNILRRNQLDPKSNPEKGTWGQFLKSHAQSLWQCDFFSKHLITPQGLRQCFILAFLHVSSRRVWLSPCTFRPDAAWMQTQAQAMLEHAKSQGLPVKVVLRDRDSKFTGAFDRRLAAGGAKVVQVQYRAPNMNAYVERFIQSIQMECLDQFLAFSQEHLDYVAGEYVQYYHHERPHQAKGNQPLVVAGEPALTEGEVVSRERLGGMLRHYYRRAA